MFIINYFKNLLRKYREKQEYKKQLEEIRKRDPFIYK